jgi:hypothetical protein
LGRATARLESAGTAVELAGAVTQHAVLIDERTFLAIDLLPLAQPLAGKADIAVVLVVVAEGRTLEGKRVDFIEKSGVRSGAANLPVSRLRTLTIDVTPSAATRT